MNALFDTLQRLGMARLIVLALVGASLLGFFSFLTTKLTQPAMGLLYADLAANDAGQIVAKLEAQNIPFELRAGGAQLWVPQDRALRLRMAMAEQGLPRGGSVGYELFDRTEALGATSFMQNLNLVRALEGELARTIAALGPIGGARVHLSIPRRDLFSRDRIEPTASVILKLREAGRLPRSQVQAIQYLIAAAVPSLKPTRVSIVDDRGTLLARGSGEADDATASSGAGSTDERRREHEQALARKIEEQLERAVGPGKIRAEVSLDMDFDRLVTSSESFDPDGQVVRSQQTVSENNDATESAGNQGVSVGNNLPENETQPGGSQNRTKTTRQEETINYEVTKKTTNHVREVGTIKRLSASVIVDGIMTAGADGKTTYQPRNPEQLEQLRNAARSAVGFNEKRGDTLELINLAFAASDLPDQSAAAPGMFDFTRGKVLRMAEIGVLFVVALLVILLVARPMIAAVGRAAVGAAVTGLAALPGAAGGGPAALAPPAGNASGAAAGTAALASAAAAISVDGVEGRVNASAMKKLGEIVEKHPEEAVAIIRNWMYQEA